MTLCLKKIKKPFFFSQCTYGNLRGSFDNPVEIIFSEIPEIFHSTSGKDMKESFHNLFPPISSYRHKKQFWQPRWMFLWGKVKKNSFIIKKDEKRALKNYFPQRVLLDMLNPVLITLPKKNINKCRETFHSNTENDKICFCSKNFYWLTLRKFYVV